MDPVKKFMDELRLKKNNKDEVREKFTMFLANDFTELSSEGMDTMLDRFSQIVKQMLATSELHQVRGAVVAIVCLVPVEEKSRNKRQVQFLNFLEHILSSSLEPAVLEVVVHGLGHLNREAGGVSTGELEKSAQWLDEGRHKLAAVLLYCELAITSPLHFYLHAAIFLERIFKEVIRDRDIVIREATGRALHAALVQICRHEGKTATAHLLDYYNTCMHEVVRHTERAEGCHGNMLVLLRLLQICNRELEGDWHSIEEMECLTDDNSPASQCAPCCGNCHFSQLEAVESSTCRRMLLEHFPVLRSIVINAATYKQPYIQKVLLAVLPRLAALNPHEYLNKDRGLFTQHLQQIAALGKPKADRDLKNVAVYSFALLVSACRDSTDAWQGCRDKFPEVVNIMADSRRQPERAAIICITICARALRHRAITQFRSVLPVLLAQPLSPLISRCLVTLIQQVAELAGEVRSSLVKTLHTLMTAPVAGVKSSVIRQQVNSADNRQLLLALRLMRQFQFDRETTRDFLSCLPPVFHYHAVPDIREEAILSCSSLLQPELALLDSYFNEYRRYGSQTLALVKAYMLELLNVSLLDPEDSVRLAALSCFSSNYDPYFAELVTLQKLLAQINDQNPDIRFRIIELVTRLCAITPALILPKVRKLLLSSLLELEHSSIVRSRESAVQTLACIIHHSPEICQMYSEAMLRTLTILLNRETASSGTVTVAALGAVAQLALVDHKAVKNAALTIFPHIVKVLEESGPVSRRQAAVKTLGQLASLAGNVPALYKAKPELLNILFTLFRTEHLPAFQLEVMRTLGYLGALDPAREQELQNYDSSFRAGYTLDLSAPHLKDESLNILKVDLTDSSLYIQLGGVVMSEYYSAVALSTLLKILADSSCAKYHNRVIETIASMFSLYPGSGYKLLPYVIPVYLSTLEEREPGFRITAIRYLGHIVKACGVHSRAFLTEIFQMLLRQWSDSAIQPPQRIKLHETIVQVITDCATAIGPEFQSYIPQVMPHLTRYLNLDAASPNYALAEHSLLCVSTLSYCLAAYDHLVLPAMLHCLSVTPLKTQCRAVEALTVFMQYNNVVDYAGPIVRGLLKPLQPRDDRPPPTPDVDLFNLITKALQVLIYKIDEQFVMFERVVTETLINCKPAGTSIMDYQTAVSEVRSGSRTSGQLPASLMPHRQNTGYRIMESGPSTERKMDELALRRHWSSSKCLSREAWQQWIHQLCVSFLQESPSPALRQFSTVFTDEPRIPAAFLFNPAFISCWEVMSEAGQQDLSRELRTVLESDCGPEIAQPLLNVAEFAEHCLVGKLSLDSDLLASAASKCQAYAKALHLKEVEYNQLVLVKKPIPMELYGSLIDVYVKLHLGDSAQGIVTHVKKTNAHVPPEWYEKLSDWSGLLNILDKRMQALDTSDGLQAGEEVERLNEEERMTRKSQLQQHRLHCLHNLGDWDKVLTETNEWWPSFTAKERSDLAPVLSATAICGQDFQTLRKYANVLEEDTYNSYLYSAVLSLKDGENEKCLAAVAKARQSLCSQLTAVVGEGYSRSYSRLVQNQLLSELEEIIKVREHPELRSAVIENWSQRLDLSQHKLADWHLMLHTRGLMIEPAEAPDVWLAYASLARRADNLPLSRRVLSSLMEIELVNDEPVLPLNKLAISYAYVKTEWRSDRTKAYGQLHKLVSQFGEEQTGRTAAKCCCRLAEWHKILHASEHAGNRDTVIKQLQQATVLDHKFYKAWHQWAQENYKTLTALREEKEWDECKMYCLHSIRGFAHSITLQPDYSLQDLLRLLTVWFEFGDEEGVLPAIQDVLPTIPTEIWLMAIPQLIARIDSQSQIIRDSVQRLLMTIGQEKPHGVLYSLSVAAKSSNQKRVFAANNVLNCVKERHHSLVNSALDVSAEFIRIAVLYTESWYDALEEASKAWFQDHSAENMMAALEPLHRRLSHKPETTDERKFHEMHALQLNQARAIMESYKREVANNNMAAAEDHMKSAWAKYYDTFKKLTPQLRIMTDIELEQVSPILMAARNLEVSVPGTYTWNKPLITIASVRNRLDVITSKQRPRRIVVIGSDGEEYHFCLKGHEDIRLDERVMQLFGLVNLILYNSLRDRFNFTIQRFSVVPLSTSSGLLGWVPRCDTLHQLIKEHRERNEFAVNLEHRVMQRSAGSAILELLTVYQKVEVFEHAIANTKGDDLAQILWAKSPRAEVWLQRRSTYIQSLATMSMVGYILGLGDRHPSNLMLNRTTGKVVHIDFGDCFETAQKREKYPEKIPFRLTRMMIKAMEVTGIDGSFRHSCELVMSILRQNKDSLMAMLEAFVHDPLINPKLLDEVQPPRAPVPAAALNQGESGADVVGVESFSRPIDEFTPGVPPLSVQPNLDPEALKKRSVEILETIREKLNGRVFAENQLSQLSVEDQVDMLIQQATSSENLAQAYVGWCSFW